MNTEAHKKAIKKYKAENIHRVALEMQNTYFYEVLKPAAEKTGESVNGFIKKAIAQRIEKEGL